MAAMSVIGIDFGNESCYVAVAKAGGIETIANDYSLRATPSFIAFSGKNRILGVAAKNQQVTNMKNTVYSLKRLLGRQYNDPHVQQELKYLPYNVVPNRDGSIGIKVHYLEEEHVFTPEQCTAMLLTKLKDTSAIALQTQVNDCVLSVPSYFTNKERGALLDAATIAGLNVLRLMNETTATALAYGIYKQDLPAPEEKARNVVFVDCGHSSLQVFACAFHRGKLRMLTTAADPHLGGRDFDLALANHFCKEFQAKYKIDAHSNARAFIRLLAEVEKIKKQMSANSTTLPLNIECFMDDKDVHGDMKRSEMETLCETHFERVEKTLRLCLQQSKLSLDEIHSVEIVGGSSRIPAIKHLIEKVFNCVPSTTLNQDEAVSRGCALQCAILSPAVRVRDFSVTDVQTYPINLAWDAITNDEGQGELEVFPSHHSVPYSKMLTFYRREPFALTAFYSGSIPYPDNKIGTWTIRDVKPNADGESQKVKIKVRINIHGLFTVSNASMYERKDTNEDHDDEHHQQQQQQQSEVNVDNGGAVAGEMSNGPDNDEAAQQRMQQDGTAAASEVSSTGWRKRLTNWFGGSSESNIENGNEKKDKKKKHTVKTIELPIEAVTHGYSQIQINSYVEEECKMIATDRQEKERVDVRNALEEYVYELRGKLSSDEELATFVTDQDRSSLVNQLEQMESWLYEDGENCNRQEYHDRLSVLKTQGDPIQNRRNEFDMRPGVIDDFGRAIQLAGKAIDQIKSMDPKYAHLTDEEISKAIGVTTDAHKWLEQTRQTLASAQRVASPSITCAQIRTEHQTFERAVVPIFNKPIPKPPSPPKEEKPTGGEDVNNKEEQDQQTAPEDRQQSNDYEMDCS